MHREGKERRDENQFGMENGTFLFKIAICPNKFTKNVPLSGRGKGGVSKVQRYKHLNTMRAGEKGEE